MSDNSKTRYVSVNHENPGFSTNVVVNTKYTPWNFVFKNLFEQFRQPMNCYFLLIAILQVCSLVSTLTVLVV
ncbi:phospholipid-translocating p-type ATPase [Blastocystis sp. subtype 4]|uniref:phospholipid-translocating p-type ATPase n=1 Tax=Blastocystis sp. subtype 4 TaxID=944170 RepID=UPI0007120991|nr:phospholipid-translocating p-type ATPase [Blastocystis sp. subtype 4]KNB45459.1 phospholipid-translocating p-type ATPase [Blastocystis sp. subtype 4]|eukprot:XP_014528899.1 phospholipid-translocating p-type ATPase [Blastocystis sp. subtype 4]